MLERLGKVKGEGETIKYRSKSHIYKFERFSLQRIFDVGIHILKAILNTFACLILYYLLATFTKLQNFEEWFTFEIVGTVHVVYHILGDTPGTYLRPRSPENIYEKYSLHQLRPQIDVCSYLFSSKIHKETQFCDKKVRRRRKCQIEKFLYPIT